MGLFSFLFGSKELWDEVNDKRDKKEAIKELLLSIENPDFSFNTHNKYTGTFAPPKKFDLHSFDDDALAPLVRDPHKEFNYSSFTRYSTINTVPEHYVIFDLETTGLDAEYEDIIQIAAVKFEYDVPIEYFLTYVRPTKRIRSKITELTDITDMDVAYSPDIDYVLPNFLEFIGKNTLVAHNAKFDMSFLLDKIFNLGYKKITNKVLDTLPLSRKYIEDVENYKLETLKSELCYDLDLESHEALSDVKSTFYVLMECKDAIEIERIDNDEDEY